MPLVKLLCKGPWALPDVLAPRLNEHQTALLRFGNGLPEAFFRRLHLPNTPLEATEVRFRSFGPYDENVPDVAMRIYFAETPKEVRRHQITREVCRIFGEWETAMLRIWRLDTTIDIFWGMSNGRLNMGGKVTTW